jgi:peptidyl-tRNA hydrolase, PTH1 family
MAESKMLEVFPRLIVGLGNPGPKFDRTRHNIGFDLIDQLAKRWQISVADQKKFQGLVGENWVNHQKIVLLKPQTFMNLSGQSVRAVLDWYKLEPTEVLVLYDDLDLPLGKLRMRLSGSAGGHNGMKSIISHLGTNAFLMYWASSQHQSR